MFIKAYTNNNIFRTLIPKQAKKQNSGTEKFKIFVELKRHVNGI